MTLNPQQKFHIQNRTKLRKLLAKHSDYEGLTVISGNSHVQVSADRSYPFEQEGSFLYLTGLNEPGLVLVIKDDNEYLIVPERNAARIAFDGSLNNNDLINISGITTIIEGAEGWARLEADVKAVSKIASFIAEHAYIEVIDLYINPARHHLIERLKSYNPNVEPFSIRQEIARLRMIKSSYEIKMIEKAITATGKLLKVIERKRQSVQSERDLYAAIEHARIKMGLEHAYEPIIASGANAVTLHYIENGAPLDKNGLLLLDIGLKFNHYSADISRTVGLQPTKRQREVYDAVLDVQNYAFSLLKPGVVIRDYEHEVMEYMGERLVTLGLINEVSSETVRPYYPHSTGHFLGIDVHDIGDYERPLEPGVVLTVEPGIYIPEEGIGVRLEDNVLITQDGNRNLSNKLPKNITSLTIQA